MTALIVLKEFLLATAGTAIDNTFIADFAKGIVSRHFFDTGGTGDCKVLQGAFRNLIPDSIIFIERGQCLRCVGSGAIGVCVGVIRDCAEVTS